MIRPGGFTLRTARPIEPSFSTLTHAQSYLAPRSARNASRNANLEFVTDSSVSPMVSLRRLWKSTARSSGWTIALRQATRQ
jgi:hypothetical protein